MKKMCVVLAAGVISYMASAGYYLKINGQTVGTQYTMVVGTPYTIEVWSDSAMPMSVEPTASSQWLQDAYNLIMWTATWSGAPEAFTDMVIDYANAGGSATGWTNSAPYQYIATIGFAKNYPYGQPFAAGKWWQVTYIPQFEAVRKLGLGSYPPDYSAFRNAQYVTIDQVPEPATLVILGFGAMGLLRRKDTTRI